MIEWQVKLDMWLESFKEEDHNNKRKRKSTRLHLEYIGHRGRFEHTMKVNVPDGEPIYIDAEYMKSACEKVIALKSI